MRTPPDQIPLGVILVNLATIITCVSLIAFHRANVGAIVGVIAGVVSLAMAIARPWVLGTRRWGGQ